MNKLEIKLEVTENTLDKLEYAATVAGVDPESFVADILDQYASQLKKPYAKD